MDGVVPRRPGPDRQLTTAIKKPYWQSGWMAQHDRLMRAISNRRRGAALMVGGDLHATAAGHDRALGSIDLSANPVHVALSGTLGSKGAGFPSGLRATPPRAHEPRRPARGDPARWRRTAS